MQKYTSKDTCINKVSKIYSHYAFKPYSRVLDYGGGKYETNTEYMKQKNVSVFVYDKFNRDEEHNQLVLEQCSFWPVDYVVCSNVLNVIMKDGIINEILLHIWQLSSKAIILFKIYEGNKTAIGCETSRGYQRNERTSDYIKNFITTYFDIKSVHDGIVECTRKEHIID